MLQRPALADVIAARNRIHHIAAVTPLKPSESLFARLGGPVLLKIETMQPTCAFKVRGAAARLLELSPAERARGVALALKSIRPGIRVIGVSSDRGPAMLRSLEAGRPILVTEEESLADSLGGGIGLDNRFTFSTVRDLVDEMLTVSDHEVGGAMRHAFLVERLVLEGAGATALAVLLREAPDVPLPTVALLTGDNVDPARHLRIVCDAGCVAAEDIDRTCARR